MKKILKIQLITILLLSFISWIAMKNPVGLLVPIAGLLSMLIVPFALLSHNWGVETFLIASLIFVSTISLMVYGYKQAETNVGVVAFTLGFWTYSFASLMFLGMHF